MNISIVPVTPIPTEVQIRLTSEEAHQLMDILGAGAERVIGAHYYAPEYHKKLLNLMNDLAKDLRDILR